MPAPGRVGNRPQVRLALGRLERLVHAGGREPAGRVEVGVNQVAVIAQHLPPGGAQGAPHLGRLPRDSGVYLVSHIGPGVEALRLPAAPVLERERPRHHGLREHRLAFVGASRSHFSADHAREVALDRHPVHHGEARRVTQHIQPPAIPPAVRHGEAVLRDAHRRDAGAPLAPGAVRLHEPDARGVDHDGPHGTGGDRADRLAVRVVGDEQLSIASQSDAGRTGDEPDAQLRLRPRGEGRGLRPATGAGEGEGASPVPTDGAKRPHAAPGASWNGASEPALRPVPRRVV